MRIEPLTVEIITYAPTEFFHCTHCEVVFQQVGVGQKVHAEQRASNLPDDLKAEYERLADWVERLARRHPGQIQFKIVDAASLEGVYRTIRHRLRTFPSVVIGGKERIVGDLDSAATAVERQLRERTDCSELRSDRAPRGAPKGGERGPTTIQKSGSVSPELGQRHRQLIFVMRSGRTTKACASRRNGR